MEVKPRKAEWYRKLVIHILVWLAKYPLAPIAVLLFSTPDGKQLRRPFLWLQTNDNDLGGDSGWKNEHIKPGSDPYSFWNKVKWLWRNGGHDFNYKVLGTPNDQWFYFDNYMIQDSKEFWVRPDGYWMFRGYRKWPFSKKRLFIFTGWSLFGPINKMCKITCTFRLR